MNSSCNEEHEVLNLNNLKSLIEFREKKKQILMIRIKFI